MTPQKTFSLRYFAAALLDTSDFKPRLVEAVRTYAQGGNHHPQVAYEGPAPFFAAALYAEIYKGSGHGGFYPTPLREATEMAEWLHVDQGMTVLDPGSGFGALSWAVQQAGGTPIQVECAQYLREIGSAAWPAPIACDDFLSGFIPPPFDAVIANPPHGKVFGVTHAEAAFLSRIADWAEAGTPVCVILPQGYLQNNRPAATVEAIARYRVVKQKDLPPATFKPFTAWNTTLYLLETRARGARYVPRRAPADPPIVLQAPPDPHEADYQAALALCRTFVPERIRRDQPEAQPITDAIDLISARAEARQAAAQDLAIKGLHPAAADWLTDEERAAIGRLQIMLRDKSPAEAREDVKRKRAARRSEAAPAPVPVPASLASLRLTGSEARALLLPLLALPDTRGSRSWPARPAPAVAEQFARLIAHVPDEAYILDLYARHIWRESHTPGEVPSCP